MALGPTDDVEEVEDIGLDSGAEDQAHDKPESTTVGVAGYNIEIENRAIPYVGLILSAVILLIAIVVPVGKNTHEGYGIAVCVVSILCGMFGAYMAWMNTSLYDNPLGTFPFFGTLTLGTANAQFLFLWNFVAAGILTFDGPFLVTSNGYFACWAGVMFAIMAMGVTTESIRSQAGGMGYYNGLVVASVIQICAIIPEMGGNANGQSTYSLIICIMTIIMVLAFGAYPNIERFKFYSFAIFAILWIVLASFVTFKGPFTATGNGYFSAWLGCTLCILAASSCAPQ